MDHKSLRQQAADAPKLSLRTLAWMRVEGCTSRSRRRGRTCAYRPQDLEEWSAGPTGRMPMPLRTIRGSLRRGGFGDPGGIRTHDVHTERVARERASKSPFALLPRPRIPLTPRGFRENVQHVKSG